MLLSERFAVALLLAVTIDLKKSLQTTNVYILLCNFFLCQRSNTYYLSILLFQAVDAVKILKKDIALQNILHVHVDQWIVFLLKQINMCMTSNEFSCDADTY